MFIDMPAQRKDSAPAERNVFNDREVSQAHFAPLELREYVEVRGL